ncbi:NADH-quinone oxidoreductase subunit NuoB [Leptolyngbya sp. FACHB-261]|uniref:NADH-quinone oxidoreductase subunit NuoB n=1 Tax=Leptolyngbya sp. FACHB-261 TaxID=2692806 RepID=UPI001683589A|nr:NADH-quinone oxidoreductase subunit NuoB [Leptolyngbya sp. FACHB-261]MBD2102111.1 NADH-quinone oxidoreductase subunit NuoB [Leptolyngbya sp. FACHB-261]
MPPEPSVPSTLTNLQNQDLLQYPIEDPSQKLLFPSERPEVTQELSNNVILTTVNDLYNWARLSSIYPLLFGTACCFIEFAALIGSRFDIERFAMIPRATPRQADLIITAGTITMKMAPALVRLYEQMPEPKYVLAMGACTITAGMFSVDSYAAVRGVDKLMPVDAYIPGCPPRPEAIIDAIIKLRKKIATEDIRERGRQGQTHRYYSTTHQMKPVPDIITGTYLEAATRINPPKELVESGIPLPVLQAAEREKEALRRNGQTS